MNVFCYTTWSVKLNLGNENKSFKLCVIFEFLKQLALFDAISAASGFDATSATSSLCVNFKDVADSNASFLIVITANVKDNTIMKIGLYH